jgi:hypothetical protein
MTSVVRLQFYNFNKSKDGRNGIDDNALIRLSKHNIRKEIDYKVEIKSKQTKHINSDKSLNNICYKQLDYTEIDKIKNQKFDTRARSNSVGAFQMVFDFTENIEDFDEEAHRELILNYLSDIGILKHFDLLEFVLHIDEEREKPHFHLIFSGYDKIKKKFAVNDFFSPRQGEEIDKNGEIVFKKIANGKNRGQYQLDEDGNKIAKQGERRNGTQWLQNEYSSYLARNNYVYSNKKEFSSMLQFPIGIWRSFDTETKESIYYFRELENLYFNTKKSDPDNQVLEEIHNEMTLGVSVILEKAREIQEEQHKKKHHNINRLDR